MKSILRSFLFLLLAGCSHPPAAVSVSAGIPETVIDVHTHLFNARDLPLEGILRAKNVNRKYAHPLAKILNWWTSLHEGGDPKIDPPAIATADDIAHSLRQQLRSNSRLRGDTAIGNETLLHPLTREERQALFEFASIRIPGSERSLHQRDVSEVEVVARALARADFPPRETGISPLTAKSARTGEETSDWKGKLHFLAVVIRGHVNMARHLADDVYPNVSLFVHHMMDMQMAYADVPSRPFDQQILLAPKVDRSFNGKFVHFIAFDPFRRQDALTFVQRGLTAGAIGVKFYPPNGYRAACNELPETRPSDPDAAARWDSRYGGTSPLPPDQLNEINDRLFTYCENNDVPVFTHCSPEGFEASTGYGLKSDPIYWECALKRHPNLRLCFGHSGGDAYWFTPLRDPISGSAQFGADVVRLCLNYRNVYCETGYLERVLDAKNRKNLSDRLAAVLDQASPTGQWQFGDKIMYGTDWFMITQEDHPEHYLRDFSEIFHDPRLVCWRRRFFGANAVNFLKLPEYVDHQDNRFTESQRDYWRALIKATEEK